MSMRTADSDEYAAGVSDEAIEAVSLIDRFSSFDGTYRSEKDLRIEGEVKGTIECQGTLFVAQGADVQAKIEAASVTVAGEFKGEINCRGRLQIMPSGRLRGKVTTDTLVINEGAFYEGELQMAPPDQRVGGKNPPRSLTSIAGANSGATGPLAGQGAAGPKPDPRGLRAGPPGEGGGAPGALPGGGSAPGGNPSSTFIRRFGGPETAWDGAEDDDGPDGPEREK
jgi:cytoskeletal protein CcmA (bactofilin family)